MCMDVCLCICRLSYLCVCLGNCVYVCVCWKEELAPGLRSKATFSFLGKMPLFIWSYLQCRVGSLIVSSQQLTPLPHPGSPFQTSDIHSDVEVSRGSVGGRLITQPPQCLGQLSVSPALEGRDNWCPRSRERRGTTMGCFELWQAGDMTCWRRSLKYFIRRSRLLLSEVIDVSFPRVELSTDVWMVCLDLTRLPKYRAGTLASKQVAE